MFAGLPYLFIIFNPNLCHANRTKKSPGKMFAMVVVSLA